MGSCENHDYFSKAQARNLPVIAVTASVLQVLALGRDLILGDLSWTDPVTLVTAVGLLITAAVAIASLRSNFPARYSQWLGSAVLMAVALRHLTIIPFRGTVFPVADALVVFAMGICLLDMRIFKACVFSYVAPWVLIVFFFRPFPETAGIVGLMLSAAAIAYIVLRSRIASHTRIIELETRIGNLESLLPLCAHCKNTRLESGQWIRIEQYLYDTARKKVSHGICDDCLREHYSDLLGADELPKAAGAE